MILNVNYVNKKQKYKITRERASKQRAIEQQRIENEWATKTQYTF